jgi:IclR helix-turn-helix domain
VITSAKNPTESSTAGAARERGAGTAVIELLPSQVERVVRAAADSGSIPVLLSGLERVRGTLATRPTQMQDPRLSRSLLSGLLLVASLPPGDGSYRGNAQLARLLGMNVSTVHRYLQTLVAVGLAERDPGTRRYRLAQ